MHLYIHYTFIHPLGDEVTAHYDPMIAKLVVSSNTREMALRKLITALQRYQVLPHP